MTQISRSISPKCNQCDIGFKTMLGLKLQDYKG